VQKIRVRGQPDTDLSPYDWQTVASRQTWATGNAIIKAAEMCKQQLFAMASQVLGAPAGQLELKSGFVTDRATRQSIPLERLVMGYQFEDGHTIGGPVAAHAYHVPEGLLFLDPDTSQSDKPVAKWTFGTQGVEVSLDPETGQYTVDRVVACYDVGKVVNPGLIRGQVYGGIVQGLGTGMMEELRLDPRTGRIENASLMDYKIPTAADVPASMEAHFVETEQIDGPYGARGVGEHTMIPTPAAVANALRDACGVDLRQMPVTAERVYAALKEKESNQ
jgi:CO/xanthine dehydrogenase Mo-binding subunit